MIDASVSFKGLITALGIATCLTLNACGKELNSQPIDEEETPSVVSVDSNNPANRFRDIYAAAVEGDAVAQIQLGNVHEEGLGVPQDYGKAIEWYQKAAKQGNAIAQYNLGVIYYNQKNDYYDFERPCTGINKRRVKIMRLLKIILAGCTIKG